MSEEAQPGIQGSEKDAAVVNIGSKTAASAIPASAPRAGKVKLPSKLGELQMRFEALGVQQRLIVAAALFLFISALIFVTFSGRSKDDYRVLFSSVNERDGAAIVAALQQMNVPYKFTEGGAAILVPESAVYETRLRLAGQGLPKAGNVGFELLENQKMGTSQFVEQVNYQRGLEGELARSISSLAQVKSARVMLAIPKQTAFMREQEKPTASVVVTMHPGRFLDAQQVAAITNLVGSSVPNLGPANVTIVDAEGSLLAPNAQRLMGLDSNQLKYVAELEGALSKRVQAILEPVTGKENVRAQVTVDMDFGELERTQETFGRNSPPNQSSIRSQQSNEAATPSSSASGVPGALTNQPPGGGQAPINAPGGVAANTGPQNLNAPPSSSSSSASNIKKDMTVNYELDRAIERIKSEKGKVRRVSAAVVVNYKQPTGIDKDGKPLKPVPFSAKELDQINNLARDAVGYTEKRGDSVSVANIPFKLEVPEEPAFYKQPGVIELSKEFFKFAIILGSLGIMFFGVVKPLLFPKKIDDALEEQRIEEEFDEKIKAEMAQMDPKLREKRRMEMELLKERQRIAEEEERQRIEEERKRMEEERLRQEEEKKNEYDSLLKYATDFVAENPKVVSGIFKEWLAADAEKTNNANAAAAAAG
ncbi:flagellar basal-body MS-ring/collar protein FliF [Polynucleobacter sp. MWH-UH35A]|uniref:flagellar basal-body MS-ring/collar protein FliF n=1 Tax=Polynucleobacter sp. MWH-UH35A TaxID=1855619 RepID=UPI001BFD4F9E|nr:flagellar basal-body MS-ring/collar protein FliF [Polynucleobacter sp. MWH-UH35A]QWD59741.1 flagellar M-ring protein FliF [Polynucleobacter sp. MWH-UH35A]